MRWRILRETQMNFNAMRSQFVVVSTMTVCGLMESTAPDLHP